MKKTLLLLGFWGCSLLASAQWVTQPVAFNAATELNFSVSAVDANTAWTTILDVGIGDRTGKFARTVDGGSTWTVSSVPGLSASEYLTDLHALSTTTAWVTVAGASGRVLKTTDGGATWATQTTPAQFGTQSDPVYVHFFDANNGVAISDGFNGRCEIYTTANGGSTWTAVPAAAVPALLSSESTDTFAPTLTSSGNSIWFATSESRVFRSTDRGLTWTVASTGLTANGEFPSVLTFRDATNGLIATEDGFVQRTTDGGTTWTTIMPIGPFHPLSVDAVPGTNAYVSTGVSVLPGGAGSSYSTNDGQSWTPIESTIEHLLVDMVSPTAGWSGGARLDAGGDLAGGNGMNKFSSNTILASSKAARVLAAQVHPNPSADGRFRLQVPGGTAGQLSVYDALGRLVLARAVAASRGTEVAVDLSQQRAGVYTLELRSATNVLKQKLVVE